MRDAPPPHSLEILSAEVRDQLAGQLRHFESLDAKAGVILGFAGLLVAVAPGSATTWVDAARFAGVVSAFRALLAFFPRDYPVVDLAGLRREYLAADVNVVRLALLDTHLTILAHALLLNDQKSRRLKSSIAALLIAIMLAFIGLVVEPVAGGVT